MYAADEVVILLKNTSGDMIIWFIINNSVLNKWLFLRGCAILNIIIKFFSDRFI